MRAGATMTTRHLYSGLADLVLVVHFAIVFFNGAPGFDAWIIVTWFVTAYFSDALICGRAMHRITENFRGLAMPMMATEPPRTLWTQLQNYLPQISLRK